MNGIVITLKKEIHNLKNTMKDLNQGVLNLLTNKEKTDHKFLDMKINYEKT